MKAGVIRRQRSPTPPRVRARGASIGDDAAYAALKALGSNQGPIGCWRIRSALQEVGITASEATAGRLLRGLDLQGLTRVIGSRGRVLTPKGHRYLVHELSPALVRCVRDESLSRERNEAGQYEYTEA